MIALDANGAERGPEVAAEGARIAGIEVEIFGPPLPAIGNDEEPALAVRSRPDASVVQAARAVADGRCDALVSPGPTGATLVSALLHVKRIRGVHRPAIAVLVPVPGKPTLLLDAGANAEVRPEHLVQFAHMGATFMEAVHGVARPRVGLLSIGEEAKKGTPDVIEAHERLAGDETLNFAGNIEGTDVTAGVVDVVVTDGFTGNVALKLMEGTAATVVHAIRETIRSGAVASLGGLLIRRRVGRLRAELDPNATGGAILLGIRKPVVIAHGGSSAEGIANALRLARRAVDEHMIERTAAALETAGALRSAAAASVAESHE
jgi:glycerol-3-phosphate acyltransferase PlsX